MHLHKHLFHLHTHSTHAIRAPALTPRPPLSCSPPLLTLERLSLRCADSSAVTPVVCTIRTPLHLQDLAGLASGKGADRSLVFLMMTAVFTLWRYHEEMRDPEDSVRDQTSGRRCREDVLSAQGAGLACHPQETGHARREDSWFTRLGK